MSDDKVSNALQTMQVIMYGLIISVCIVSIFYMILVTRKVYGLDAAFHLLQSSRASDLTARGAKDDLIEKRVAVLEEAVFVHVLPDTHKPPRPIIQISPAWLNNRYTDLAKRVTIVERWIREHGIEPQVCH